jgi:ethanolamine permease
MILGNRGALWNTGLVYGNSSLLFNLLYGGSGFLCLNLCMGEMSSALPFSGGIFGFVRATLGPFLGFLVACCEIVYCITTIVLRVQRLPMGNNSTNAALIAASFAICLVFNLIGGKPVFVMTNLLGFVMTMLLIYLFGTLGSIDTDSVGFDEYAGSFSAMTWPSIIGARFTRGSQFNGLQFFPLLSEYMANPREQIPRAMIMSCCIFIVMSIFVFLAAISQYPGSTGLSSADLPLKYGYAMIFNIDPNTAMWLDGPSALGAMFGLFYCAGRQLHAITKSGLLPSLFKKTLPGSDAPYVCYAVVALAGVALNLHGLSDPSDLAEIRALSLIASYFIFICCFIAYLVFRRKFSSMTRSFTNPLGDYAAIYGIINFVSAGIGVIFYSSMNLLFLVVLGGYLVVASIFFWVYLVHNQKFSEEEKQIMFKAYLINANRNMRKNRLKNNKVGPSSGGSENVSGGGGSKSQTTANIVTTPVRGKMFAPSMFHNIFTHVFGYIKIIRFLFEIPYQYRALLYLFIMRKLLKRIIVKVLRLPPPVNKSL